MTAYVSYSQMIFRFQLFEYYVDSLNTVNRAFSADKDWCVDSNRLNMLVTFTDM